MSCTAVTVLHICAAGCTTVTVLHRCVAGCTAVTLLHRWLHCCDYAAQMAALLWLSCTDGCTFVTMLNRWLHCCDYAAQMCCTVVTMLHRWLHCCDYGAQMCCTVVTMLHRCAALLWLCCTDVLSAAKVKWPHLHIWKPYLEQAITSRPNYLEYFVMLDWTLWNDHKKLRWR